MQKNSSSSMIVESCVGMHDPEIICIITIIHIKDPPLSPPNVCSVHAILCPLYSAKVCAPTLSLLLHQYPWSHLLKVGVINTVNTATNKTNLLFIYQNKRRKGSGKEADEKAVK